MRERWVGVLVVMFGSMASAAPIDDLSSPLQATRDAAAKALRASYKPAPRSKWEPVLASLKMGTKKADVLAQLAPYNVKTELGHAGGFAETVSYRLDDNWALQLSFTTTRDTKLFKAELGEDAQAIWVELPKDFTGTWVVYYANGHKSSEIQYRSGGYFGTFTGFRPDGSKAVVQRYGAKGIEGDEVGYHPSGNVAYKGQYKDGKRSGRWTWYDDNGKVTSTRKR